MSDYPLEPLGNICEINPDTLAEASDPTRRYRYIDLSSIKEQKTDLRITPLPFAVLPSRARRRVAFNDVLLGTVRPNLKNFAIIESEDNDLLCSTGFAVLRSKKNISDPRFIFHVINSEIATRQLNALVTGSNYPAVNATQVADLLLPIPPLPEQKKIAEILSGIDNSIKSLRLKKEKVKFAKSATSLHIFKSLKDSEQTATQVSDLQSLASIPISYGVLVPDNATREGGVPMIKIQDINQGKIQTEKLSYISRTLHDRYAKTEVKTGDLLISLIGSIGITARVPDVLEGANVSRQFAVIRTSSPAISDYLHCFLRGGVAQEKISFLSQGNAQKALNLDSLRGLEVPLKSNAEMDRIVRICQALDLIIESISRRIDKAEKIRLSVASDLLSGRKRVTI